VTKETKPRPIRMTDQQWDDYRKYLGNIWLLRQITKAAKKANAPAHTKTTKE